jgi:quercetin dioxygenase-like cupin family protein
VRIDPLFNPFDEAHVQGAQVNFEPGARTAWHTHPRGQTLVVLSGLSRVQREGGPIEEIRPGDVVWFESREKTRKAVGKPRKAGSMCPTRGKLAAL